MPRAGRTPHGVRGLKSGSWEEPETEDCRTPHGVRGLKCSLVIAVIGARVAPLTGCVD